MNLEVIKKLSENRSGGLKKLAADIGMSEQNFHRCIRNNKIQAADLEKIALLLKVDVRIFFDDEISTLSGNVATVNGNSSVAAINSDVKSSQNTNTLASLEEKVRLLEELLAEKERLIKILMKERK